MKTKHKVQRFKIKKNLTRAEAFAITRKKAKQDFRGFSYNPKTGNASLI